MFREAVAKVDHEACAEEYNYFLSRIESYVRRSVRASVKNYDGWEELAEALASGYAASNQPTGTASAAFITPLANPENLRAYVAVVSTAIRKDDEASGCEPAEEDIMGVATETLVVALKEALIEVGIPAHCFDTTFFRDELYLEFYMEVMMDGGE